MANTPRKRVGSLSRSRQIVKTNLGAIGGGINDMEEVNTKRLVCTSILRREGGIMELEFDYRLGEVEERLQDMEFESGYEQLVEVEIEMPAGVQDLLIGWGELLTQEPQVEGGESVPMVARVSQHHFGIPLAGMHLVNHEDSLSSIESDPLIHPGTIVFNPEIDGEITGNMANRDSSISKVRDPGPDVAMSLRLWIDPESTRTAAARTLNRNYDSEEWTLVEAVRTLCHLCNPLEEFVINPTKKELEGVFKNEEEPIRNFSLQAGLGLQECLSELLKPHGYSWYLSPGRNQDQNSPDYGTTEIRIRIFKLGEGVKRQLNQPAPGGVLAANGKQNLIGWRLRQTFDFLRNRITAHGGLVQREVTIILEQGWVGGVAVDVAKLMRDNPEWINNQDVLRKWVGNEAGDLIGQNGITEPLDLSEELGESTAHKRRQFEDCLTRMGSTTGETRRRSPLIEYFAPLATDEKEVVTFQVFGDPDSASFKIHWLDAGTEKEVGPFTLSVTASAIESALTGQGVAGIENASGSLSSGIDLVFSTEEIAPDFWIEGTFVEGTKPAITANSSRWKPIPDGWSPQLLETELGVYFASDEAVQQLHALGSDAAIRITATVTGDDRLTSTAERESTSPMNHDCEVVFDVSDRFFDRQIQRTGEFASKLIGALGSADTEADERDDTDQINDWTERVRKLEDALHIEGTMQTVGLRIDYEIGDLLRRIDGRNVSLNRKATDSGEVLYPQITAIQYLPLEQRTVLYVEPLDQSEAELRDLERRRRKSGKKPGGRG